GYSESSAFRRIQTMRLLKEVPEVETKIVDGTLTLSAAAQVQTFLKSESKVGQAQRTAEEKLQLISSVENKSSREIEKQLLSMQVAAQIPLEKVRQITDNHTELRLVLPEELRNKLDHLRLLLSHVNPEMNYLELFQYLCEKALKQLDRAEKTVKTSPSSKKFEGVISIGARHISADLKAKIWQRDQGMCTYMDHKSKRRCESKFQLQIDHIRPFSLGGDNSEDNLRLLCSHHNLHRARKTFGEIGRFQE
ncbi:MAG: HNH endonuclease, partial [Bdellovibrio sp.]|nr:HNH endonuclease [Bdellovibrio sp.]